MECQRVNPSWVIPLSHYESFRANRLIGRDEIIDDIVPKCRPDRRTGRSPRRLRMNLFCRSCIDHIRAQLDKPGRRPAFTDREIDSEIYPLKLEEASGEEPEDWNMECHTCDRSFDYVSLPISGEEQTIVPELGPTVPVSRQAGGQMSHAVGRRST